VFHAKSVREKKINFNFSISSVDRVAEIREVGVTIGWCWIQERICLDCMWHAYLSADSNKNFIEAMVAMGMGSQTMQNNDFSRSTFMSFTLHLPTQ